MPFDDEGNPTDAKSLRDRMEEAIADAKAVKAELHVYKVKDTLTEKGFGYVKAEELAGVPLDQVESKAKQLQDERVQMQQTLLKDALAKGGVPEADIDAMVTDLLTERQAASPDAEASKRAQSVGSTAGGLVPRENPDNLHGYDALEAHFATQKN